MDQDNKNKPADAQPVAAMPVTPATPEVPTTSVASQPVVETTPSMSIPTEAPKPMSEAPAITEKLDTISPTEPVTTPAAVTPMAQWQEPVSSDVGATPPPSVPPTPADPGYAQTKSHSMMFVVIGIIVLVVVSLAVLFFYRQFTNMTGSEATMSPSPQAAVSPTKPPISPTVTPANAEEKELQQIDIGEVDTEFKNIEKDITDL